MLSTLCVFAEDLRELLDMKTAFGVLRAWERLELAARGREAMGTARRGVGPEPLIHEVDELLRRALGRMSRFGEETTGAANHLRTFEYPELQRLQCASSALLVDRRFGPAGVKYLIEDPGTPRARRYFAFLCLAERHLPEDWRFFHRYLSLRYHHSLVALAVEVMAYYPTHHPARRLVGLFQAVRGDQHLRAFLGPRILRTLYLLGEPCSDDLFRSLLVVGHTTPHPSTCEVTLALVNIHRSTGRIMPSAKFGSIAAAKGAISAGRRVYDREESVLTQVSIL